MHANISKVNGYMINEPLLPNQTGYYGVYQWTNPIFLQQVIANETFDPNGFPNFTVVLPVRDFMITPEKLRTSLDLAQIYNKIYVPLSQQRFEGFVDLSKHRYNFNYEVYNGPGQPLELLNEDGSNIPKYLQAMLKDLEFQSYDIFNSNVNTTIDALYKKDFSLFNSQDETVQALYRADPMANRHKIKKILITHYTSYLHNTTYSYAEYPATKASGMYEIRLRLNPPNHGCGDVATQLAAYGFSEEQIGHITSEGIPLQLLNVTKNPSCSDCSPRRIYLDTDVDLLETNFALWKALRKLMTGNNQTLALGGNVKQPFSFTKCFSHNIELFVPGEDGDDGEIKVRPVRGAQEVNIYVEVRGLTRREADSSILSVESTIFEEGESFRHGETVNAKVDNGTKITLPRLSRPNDGSIKNDLHSSLYRQISIEWTAGQHEKVKVHYSLPHFTVRADYRLVVDLASGVKKGLLRLEDLDWQFKRALFENYHEDFQ